MESTCQSPLLYDSTDDDFKDIRFNIPGRCRSCQRIMASHSTPENKTRYCCYCADYYLGTIVSSMVLDETNYRRHFSRICINGDINNEKRCFNFPICTVRDTKTAIIRHEINCDDYRESCIMCDWLGSTRDVLDHYEHMHNIVQLPILSLVSRLSSMTHTTCYHNPIRCSVQYQSMNYVFIFYMSNDGTVCIFYPFARAHPRLICTYRFSLLSSTATNSEVVIYRSQQFTICSIYNCRSFKRIRKDMNIRNLLTLMHDKVQPLRVGLTIGFWSTGNDQL